ncbi:MAG: acetyl-CoA carboxylase, carboxyltransferase subunit beta [Eubacteriales bacterium]|nr:acetyl-CoA carboxylase, carboxyltransferase subunit beta [Eubacteriales bacterium]
MLKDFFNQKKTETGSKLNLDKLRGRITGGRSYVFSGEEKNKKKYISIKKPEVPNDCYRKCPKCGKALYNQDVKENNYICPSCGEYFRVHAYRRIEMLCDEGSFEEFNQEMDFVNPLDFPGYEKKLRLQQEKYKLNEAVITGFCKIKNEAAVICVCDSRFIMSSMGYNFGEKVTRAIETATMKKLPVIIYCASGGARMQEGIVSLMQMAKTSAALKKHHDEGLLYISVLTNPTTGGVTASFAMLGDVILAEPKALIGFAGPRVIEQTIGQKLPDGFQSSEFLLEHGFVDIIAEREKQRDLISYIIRSYKRHDYIDISGETVGGWSVGRESAGKLKGADFLSKNANTRAWDRVELSRRSDRPKALDYIENIFDSFLELHGDRHFGDDRAIVAGLAEIKGIPVTVIAEQKGRNVKENIDRNFGMPDPEGYRKALRLILEADRAGRPIICFVDTPGAYPGISSEERGQGEAIARCLFELSGVKVPVLSIVISEGGSGGALALSLANEVWMLENATYSILSPEGFASILYKDAKRAKEAAELMKITARDLLNLNVIEKVIPELKPADKDSVLELSRLMKNEICSFIEKYEKLTKDEIYNKKQQKFRNL